MEVRYNGMRLVEIDGSTQVAAEGRRPVLVFTDRSLALGLVVDEIVDIVEDVVSFDRSGTVPGTLGSAIVQGRATDILDASWYLRLVGGEREAGEAAGVGVVPADGRRVLLVDGKIGRGHV